MGKGEHMKCCHSFRELAQDPLKSELTKPVHIPIGRINRDSVGYKKRERRGEGDMLGISGGREVKKEGELGGYEQDTLFIYVTNEVQPSRFMLQINEP